MGKRTPYQSGPIMRVLYLICKHFPSTQDPRCSHANRFGAIFGPDPLTWVIAYPTRNVTLAIIPSGLWLT